MKTKDASRFLAVALSFSVLAVYGCGGGGGGGGGGTPTGTTTGTTGTTISNASQAGSAGGGASQGASIGSNTGQSLSNIAAGGGSVGAAKYRSPLVGKDARFNRMHAAEVKAMKTPAAKRAAFLKKARAAAAGSKAPVTIPSSTMNCDSGGTFTIGGSYDDATFAYDITMTFSNCREMGEQLNGPIKVSGTFSTTGGDTLTMTLGDGDGIIETAADFRVEEFANNYTVLFAKYIADMTVAGSETAEPTANSYSFTFTANGKEEYSDFIETYTMTFTNVIFTTSMTYNVNATTWSGSDTVNGVFTESWVVGTATGTATNSVSVTFGDGDTVAEPTTNTNPDFTIAWNETTTYSEFSVDGQIVVDYTVPGDPDCYDGTFLIDTTTPLREEFSMGHISQGTIVVNGNTTIVFSHGQVTVTVDGTATTYASVEALENVCPIEDMEQDTGSQTTFNNTTTTTVSTTGNSLVATLTWTGTGCPSTGCTSDMDLHLAHYATTTPTSTSATDWEVYYAADDPQNVLPNDDPATPIVTSSAGEVIGGFEGNLDYDDVDGYGPEHITVNPLLTGGYYVLYVDSFSLDSDPNATVTVTLDIGGNLYTFPTHTFSSTATTSYRVVDIRVDSTGAVTLLPPDTSLPLLYPAPGARPAKVRR